MKVWFFGVGEYEDWRPVGPFATEALAQKAYDAYVKHADGFLNDPTSEVYSSDVKGVRATNKLIAQRIEATSYDD